jgi:hypothetical protein
MSIYYHVVIIHTDTILNSKLHSITYRNATTSFDEKETIAIKMQHLFLQAHHIENVCKYFKLWLFCVPLIYIIFKEIIYFL